MRSEKLERKGASHHRSRSARRTYSRAVADGQRTQQRTQRLRAAALILHLQRMGRPCRDAAAARGQRPAAISVEWHEPSSMGTKAGPGIAASPNPACWVFSTLGGYWRTRDGARGRPPTCICYSMHGVPLARASYDAGWPFVVAGAVCIQWCFNHLVSKPLLRSGRFEYSSFHPIVGPRLISSPDHQSQPPPTPSAYTNHRGREAADKMALRQLSRSAIIRAGAGAGSSVGGPSIPLPMRRLMSSCSSGASSSSSRRAAGRDGMVMGAALALGCVDCAELDRLLGWSD